VPNSITGVIVHDNYPRRRSAMSPGNPTIFCGQQIKGQGHEAQKRTHCRSSECWFRLFSDCYQKHESFDVQILDV